MHVNHRANKGKSKVLRGCIVLLVAVLVILGVAVFARKAEKEITVDVQHANERLTYDGNTAETDERIYIDGGWYTPKQNLETYLIMGVDNFETIESMDAYNSTSQSDFNLLLVYDKQTNEACAIHLNRDTMTQIPVLSISGKEVGTFTGQLALAYAYGTTEQSCCENQAKAVESLLNGQNVDHYVSMTMSAIPILNDGVGGVSVTITDDFSDSDPTLVQGETVLLMGEHALKYVRARSSVGEGTNLERMRRQREYMQAWIEKAKALTEDQMTDIFADLTNYMCSDCTINDLKQLASIVQEATQGEIYSIEGEAKHGKTFIEFYPDEAALQQLVLDIFYN